MRKWRRLTGSLLIMVVMWRRQISGGEPPPRWAITCPDVAKQTAVKPKGLGSIQGVAVIEQFVFIEVADGARLVCRFQVLG